MKEIWVDIKGFEGKYEVSNLGRIKSLKKKNNSFLILKPRMNNNGYALVHLGKSEIKLENALIHRLVANTFIKNPENKPFINHINGIKSDNIITNLEWCTKSENSIHAYKTGLQKPPNKGKFGGNHPMSKLVLDTQTGIYYESRNEAALAKNINKGGLSLQLTGKRPNHTSFIYV